ncbi:1-acyl-sn-glycerol-3-phosphate acyltransferase [Rhodospirillaceae bacterium]|nr:1-acyl-sn-glycerol-3-phosphate acyltransferase [Rhodospirillaceae bacterium]MDC1441051.1 1-acyl-sn-glycerol-3-phosphate acyltransferase [Rhodospirillaceae bacterium]
MILIRSAIFNFILVLTILLMGLLAFPLLIGSRKRVCWLRDRWVKFILFSLKIVVGLDYRVEGLENLPKGRFMVASKHQSAWETLALHLIFPDPSIVLKKELLKLPILGRFIEKVGMVPIDRSGRASALKSMLIAARKWANIGRPIIIFPQGTRVTAGEKHNYHSGVFAVYRALKVPVVPVALNSGMFWSRKAFIKKPGIITVRVLSYIRPGMDRKEFMEKLEDVIETETELLEEIE